MKMVLASLSVLLGAGCNFSPRPFPVDRLEFLDLGRAVSIGKDGVGQYRSAQMFGPDRTGSFKLSLVEFDRLLVRLAPFYAQADSTDAAVDRFLNHGCPVGVPSVTDAASASIRWQGRALDRTFIVDFGCDYKRHAARNHEVRAIFESLPAPQSDFVL